MHLVSLKEFEKYGEKISRDQLPLNETLHRVYNFLETNRGSYSVEEIAKETDLKTGEVWEAINILRDEYGLRIDENYMPIGSGAITLYTLK